MSRLRNIGMHSVKITKRTKLLMSATARKKLKQKKKSKMISRKICLQLFLKCLLKSLKSAYLYPWPLYFRLRIYICDVGEKQKGHRQGRPIDRTIVSYLAGGLSRMSGITTGSCSGGCPRSSDLEADFVWLCFSPTVPS